MENFKSFTPTRMISGKNTHQQVGKVVKEYGLEKVPVHFGGSSAKRSGLLDVVTGSPETGRIQYVTLGDVQANLALSKAREGIGLYLKEGMGLVLAIGGDSMIDSPKYIANGAGNPDVDVWTYFRQEAVPARTLPVGVILTFSTSGSEVNASYVITNEENGFKRGFNSVTHCLLLFICNPELTCTVSKYQTAYGTVDIMMYTLEWYFNKTGSAELTDCIIETLLRSTAGAERIADRDSDNYEARAALI